MPNADFCNVIFKDFYKINGKNDVFLYIFKINTFKAIIFPVFFGKDRNFSQTNNDKMDLPLYLLHKLYK